MFSLIFLGCGESLYNLDSRARCRRVSQKDGVPVAPGFQAEYVWGSKAKMYQGFFFACWKWNGSGIKTITPRNWCLIYFCWKCFTLSLPLKLYEGTQKEARSSSNNNFHWASRKNCGGVPIWAINGHIFGSFWYSQRCIPPIFGDMPDWSAPHVDLRATSDISAAMLLVQKITLLTGKSGKILSTVTMSACDR